MLRLQLCATVSGWSGAGDGTQGFMHALIALYQLSYVPSLELFCLLLVFFFCKQCEMRVSIFLLVASCASIFSYKNKPPFLLGLFIDIL